MSELCIVRQPIFLGNGEMVGYEIRFRDTPEGRETFAKSFLTGSFNSIREEKLAFVPCPDAEFLQQITQLAEPASVVPLIPLHIANDEQVIQTAERYFQGGGQIGLDHFIESFLSECRLFKLVQWLRVDVRVGDTPLLGAIVAESRAHTEALLIADHIYDAQQLSTARSLGFDAFEGAHLSRPEPQPSSELPTSTVAALRLLGQARDPSVKDSDLEESFAADPVLTFQLLRIVNSASVGARGVTSIGHAIRLLGRNALMRWLAVVIAATRRTGTDLDTHIVKQAVERARLCEQLAGQGRDSGTLFLVGLFSLLDAVFLMPMEELVSRVALSEDAHDALLGRSGPYADALNFAESYELGLFESATDIARSMGVNPSTIGAVYTGALSWTSDVLSPFQNASFSGTA